jgi:hypothetical protein
MELGTALNVLLWIVTVGGYIIMNLNNKVVKLEKAIQERDLLLQSLEQIVAESDKQLKELDRRGIYQSDDEVGTFFKTLQNVQEVLNSFFRSI